MRAEPEGIDYWYLDGKTEKWKIKDDAPDWAKEEFESYMKSLDLEPDENGIVTDY